MINDARRCPFCRSDDLIYDRLMAVKDAYTVRVTCRNCGASGPKGKLVPMDEVFKMALELWNNRERGTQA
jgi:Lar family restriction alleviation protein